MKIALVHNFHSATVPSGENEVVVAEAAALRRAGHDVALAAVHNDAMSERPFHRLQGAATVVTGVGISALRLLDRFEPDVIHVHSLFPYFGSRWLQRAPAPVVATLHSYRSVCANGYLFRDGDVCTRCPDGQRWSGLRYGCYRGSMLATLPLSWAGRRGPAGDPLLRRAAALLVLSERAREVFSAAGVDGAKLEVDAHFLPDGLHSVGARRHDGGWLFVGRLTPEKGIDRLIDEWPPAEPLRVVGDGPLRAELEAAARGKQVEFYGSQTRAAVASHLRTAFGLVFPSRWYETFGLAYMEALAAGTPTIAFRPTVVADAVERDGTGLVASWGAVGGALERGRASFDELRDRCRAVFEERYTEAAFVARRSRLYQRLSP